MANMFGAADSSSRECGAAPNDEQVYLNAYESVSVTILHSTVCRAQRAFEDAFDGGFSTAILPQHIQFGSTLIGDAPQCIRPAAQIHEHFIKVPRRARLTLYGFRWRGKLPAGWVAPARTNSYVTVTLRSSSSP
ncbi:hypothetical protein [Mycetohabitans rhizoxinica]|uniref:Uncharacterized protein n=1 Tax=Mycetohabitans rhizoxinica TaxID=412963 RepID=A0ABZ2PYP9_9BURK